VSINVQPAIGLKKNAVYSSLGAIFRLAIAVLTAPLLIRAMGIETYGTWTVLLSIINVVLALQPGWDIALTYFIAQSRGRQAEEEVGRTAGSTLLLLTVWGALIALLVSVCAPWLIHLTFGGWGVAASAFSTLPLLGIMLLPRLVQQWAIACEAGVMRYDVSAKIEGLNILFQNLGLIGLAWLGQKMNVMAAWLLGVSIVFVLVHFSALMLSKHALLPPLSFTPYQTRALLKYGLTQWVSRAGSVLFSQGDRVLVNLFLGPAATGLYAAVSSVAGKINELVAMPLQSLIPAVSNAQAAGEKQRIINIYRRALHLTGFLVYLLCVSLSLGAYPVMFVFVSRAYAALGADLLRVMAPIYSFYCLAGASYSFALGLRRPDITAVTILLGGVATFLLMVLLIPVWGIWGAAVGNIGFGLVWIMYFSVGKTMGLGLRWIFKESALLILCLVVAIGISVCNYLTYNGNYLITLAYYVASMGLLVLIYPDFVKENLKQAVDYAASLSLNWHR
jgi:O-antigen/teichoic acid export membrane protein